MHNFIKNTLVEKDIEKVEKVIENDVARKR